MKLGIVVVYYLKDSDLSLLQIHLSKIYEHTKSNFEIFAGDNGLQPAARNLLEKTPHLNIYNPPVKMQTNPKIGLSTRVSKFTDYLVQKLNIYNPPVKPQTSPIPPLSAQISSFTDYLVQKAVEAGSSNIVIMHVDSFPVRDGWDLLLAERLNDKYVLSAILRKENYDTVLTFPACIFFTASFYLSYKPSMFPDRSQEYEEFLTKNNQLHDCGIGYSFALHKAGLCWHPLLRSNRVDEHPIVGGIYGDLIFHLGGGSRKELFYRKDFIETENKIKQNELKKANMSAMEMPDYRS